MITFTNCKMILPKLNKYYPFLNYRQWVIGLIALYLFIYIVPPGLIPHSEHDHLGLTDDALEKDPCHISIYHPGESGGCNHKYHISKEPGDCPLCHVTMVRQIFSDFFPGPELAFSLTPCQINVGEGTIIHFLILHDDRGPPASSSI